MLIGVILTILTGLTWAGISIMMSTVARYRISVFLFYWIGNAVAAVIAWLSFPEWNTLKTVSGDSLTILFLLLFFSGFVNVASQAMMVLTLKLGHNGISIAVRNCAAAIPFLAGVFLWHDKVALSGFIGLAMILSGMVCIVLGRQEKQKTSGNSVTVKWLFAVVMSLFFSGTFQLLNSLTARLSPETLDTGLRIPLLLTFCSIGNCIAFALSQKRKETFSNPRYLLPGMAATWSVLAIISYFAMFRALDIMNGIGASALVFPIVIGVNITTFSLYSRFRLRERYTKRTLCSLFLCVSGIIILTLK